MLSVLRIRATKLSKPLLEANSIGVLSLSSNAKGSALASSKALAAKYFPALAAKCMGVFPDLLTNVRSVFGSAKRSFITLVEPANAARCKGVSPRGSLGFLSVSGFPRRASTAASLEALAAICRAERPLSSIELELKVLLLLPLLLSLIMQVEQSVLAAV